MPQNLHPTLYVARADGDQVEYNTVGFGGPWVYLQLFDHAYREPLSGVSYTLRGVTTRHLVQGITDSDGVLYHDRLPDDGYEITCRGTRELIPLYYDDDRSIVYDPWPLRLRALRNDRR